MARLADIEAHVSSMQALLGIVGAMRSLAATRVQEAQRALPGIRRYASVMAEAIGSTLPFIEDPCPPPLRTDGGGRALVVVAAEHGFAGGYNESVMKAAGRLIRPTDTLLIIGSRGAAAVVERGMLPHWSDAMATRTAGALETTHRLSTELYRRLTQEGLAQVEVLFSRYTQLGHWSVERRSILPLDYSSIRIPLALQPPLHALPPEVLLERLTGEYVFALLMETVVESLASENSARFAAMESAHENVTKKLASLRGEANRVRQEEITTELVDLVVGAEAVSRPSAD